MSLLEENLDYDHSNIYINELNRIFKQTNTGSLISFHVMYSNILSMFDPLSRYFKIEKPNITAPE